MVGKWRWTYRATQQRCSSIITQRVGVRVYGRPPQDTSWILHTQKYWRDKSVEKSKHWSSVNYHLSWSQSGMEIQGFFTKNCKRHILSSPTVLRLEHGVKKTQSLGNNTLLMNLIADMTLVSSFSDTRQIWPVIKIHLTSTGVVIFDILLTWSSQWDE